MYTWLKEEMTKKTAKCIASQLLGQINEDHVESIELSSRRRMAVDRLLKHVLQRNPSYPAHLKTFLEILECHCESADAFRHNMLNALPTEEETKGKSHFITVMKRQFLSEMYQTANLLPKCFVLENGILFL